MSHPRGNRYHCPHEERRPAGTADPDHESPRTTKLYDSPASHREAGLGAAVAGRRFFERRRSRTRSILRVGVNVGSGAATSPSFPWHRAGQRLSLDCVETASTGRSVSRATAARIIPNPVVRTETSGRSPNSRLAPVTLLELKLRTRERNSRGMAAGSSGRQRAAQAQRLGGGEHSRREQYANMERPKVA
jgi:hypothetical protein